MSVPSELVDSRRFSWKEASAPGIAAVKHSWAPILLIQVIAACLVIAYYRSPSFQIALEALERIKAQGGIPFDLLAGAVAGGIVPCLAKAVTGKAGRIDGKYWGDMAFAGVVYAIVAVEVDLFYHLQSSLFGTGRDLATLAKKDILDMGVFSPVLSIPSAVVLFECKNAGFSIGGLFERMRSQFYRSKVIPALIPCWVFWVPMLVCIYALPPNLQFPLAQLAEASWAALFIFIATEPPEGELPI